MTRHILLNSLWIAVFLHILAVWFLAWQRGRQARHRQPPHLSLQGQPLVSILIPAWNERAMLAETLDALRQSEYPCWEALLIAGGPDGTYEYARQLCAGWPNFTVLEQPPRGKNAALNLGWRKARGEIFVLLDADTRVAPDWLGHLVAPLTQGYDAASANYFPYRQTWVSAVLEMEKIASYFVHDTPTLQGCGGIALKRQILEHKGGFPEEVTVGVDWDLDRRLAQSGCRRCFVPQAHAQTALPDTLLAYWRNQIRWRRAHLRTIFRYLDLASARGLLFYGAAVLFFSAPFALLLPKAWSLLPLLWCWILLRRLGLVIECAAFSRKASWLSWSGAVIVLLIVDFAAALIALATFRKRVVFFQGARSRTSAGRSRQ